MKSPQEIQQMQDGFAGEILQLRYRVKFLEERNKELEQIHQLDMSEIVYQRRIIDFLMEASNEQS